MLIVGYISFAWLNLVKPAFNVLNLVHGDPDCCTRTAAGHLTGIKPQMTQLRSLLLRKYLVTGKIEPLKGKI